MGTNGINPADSNAVFCHELPSAGVLMLGSSLGVLIAGMPTPEASEEGGGNRLFKSHGELTITIPTRLQSGTSGILVSCLGILKEYDRYRYFFLGYVTTAGLLSKYSPSGRENSAEAGTFGLLLVVAFL